MPQLTVDNVPEALVDVLRTRAAEHGRSPQDELRLILEQALVTGESDFWDAARRLRARTAGRHHTPSEILIRETREER